MELSEPFTWAWLAWGAGFAVIEGIALARKEKGDTLSEHIWKWFRVKDSGTHATIRKVGLAGFMVWLTIHFVAP